MDEDQKNTAHAVYIASLIHRLREKGTLSDTEWSELAAWRAANERNEELFHHLNDHSHLLSQLRQIDSAAFEQPIQHLLRQLGTIPRGRVKRLPTRKTWLSAAAVLLLLLAGTWFFFHSSKHPPMQAPAIASTFADITPGTNTATLTLSNGATIVLDTAQNGQLAQQDQVKVLKTADGQLAYASPATRAPRAMEYNILTTPRGGQYQLKLPDGTRIWLDAASSIRYPVAFTGRERKVTITGQVYFEIAPNAAMPFIVQKDQLSVEVLGTHFNMKTYEEDGATRITLLEGAVRVKSEQGAVVLKPGQQAAVQGREVQVVDDPDLEGVMAWKNGLFKFDNSDLKTIMQEAARWYDVEVVYEGQPSDERFKGKVSRNSKLSVFLKILELNNIHFSVEGKKITVLQKNP